LLGRHSEALFPLDLPALQLDHLSFPFLSPSSLTGLVLASRPGWFLDRWFWNSHFDVSFDERAFHSWYV
jgi:hypothetical protein